MYKLTGGRTRAGRVRRVFSSLGARVRCHEIASDASRSRSLYLSREIERSCASLYGTARLEPDSTTSRERKTRGVSPLLPARYRLDEIRRVREKMYTTLLHNEKSTERKDRRGQGGVAGKEGRRGENGVSIARIVVYIEKWAARANVALSFAPPPPILESSKRRAIKI